MSESKVEITLPESSPSVNKSRWRWLGRFLLCVIVLLVGLAFFLNGSLGRWILKDQIQKITQKQGLIGDFQVSGTLLSGYTFSDVQYTSAGGISSAEVGQLRVGYTVKGLLNKEIEAVELASVKVKVDLAKFPESEKSAKDPEKPSNPLSNTFATLEKIRPWVISPDIWIDDLDVEIVKEGNPVAAFQWEEFRHLTESEEFKIDGFAAQNADRLNTEPQHITLRWLENGATLNRWELLPGLIVQETLVDWSSVLKGETGLVLGEAILKAELDDALSFQLEQGVLSSDFIQESVKVEIPAQGEVDELRLLVKDWKKPIKEWDVDANVNLLSASFQKYELGKTRIMLRQKEGAYDAQVEGNLNDTPLTLTAKGRWTEGETWWKNTALDYTVNVPAVGALPAIWVEDLPEIELVETGINLAGELELKELTLQNVTSKGEITGLIMQGVEMPLLDVDVSLKEDLLTARLNIGENETASVQGTYQLQEKRYDGSLNLIKAEPEWLNALIAYSKQDISLLSSATLSWTGKGDLKKPIEETLQTGLLEVNDLKFSFNKVPSIVFSTTANYVFPQSLEVKSLQIDEGEWAAAGTLNWDGSRVTIPGLTVNNLSREIASLNGEIPYSIDVKSAEAFLAQPEEISLNLITDDLNLSKISDWTGATLPAQLTGKIGTDLKLTGTLSAPQIQGDINLLQITGLNPNLKEALDLKIDLESKGKEVFVNTSFIGAESSFLTAEGTLPFTPLKWVEDPKSVMEELKESPLKAEFTIHDFTLQRVAPFVPQLEKITGKMSAKGRFTGSVNDPEYEVKVRAEVPTLELTTSEVGLLRNVILDARMNEDRVVTNKLTAQINGGKFQVSGTVEMNDFKNPAFNLHAEVNQALLFRDDLLSIRANGDLKLVGAMDAAQIRGEVGLVESIVYKDIELIPIGVPSSAVAKVKLPALSSGSNDSFPVPAPFSDWTLNVTLKTEDPILIRGNIAKGEVEGEVKIRGNLKRPEPDGAFYLTDTQARLPFSMLEVKKGEVLFAPKDGVLNPTLRIPGASKIAGYDIDLLVYGKAAAPKTNLTSFPPLPESEIMSLLATGSTTEGLENSSAVALKAFQLFLLKMKEQKNIPGGNMLFGALLSVIDQLDLQVGQDDKFTGRKFTSANVDLSEHWGITTQIDEEQRARGLLVYMIRFK